MKLNASAARSRIVAHDHGVLCTVHERRGVDAVPVVYAVDDDDHLGIPIDRVKPKASVKLQRRRNLEYDPRATLLIEHWDHGDWSKLWWVRAELRWHHQPSAVVTADLADRLTARYAQYEARPFAEVLVFDVVAVTGWAASSGDTIVDPG